MITIGITNKKGGIGKSTTALALADALQKKEKRVLMIDTDPQRNTTKVYKAKTENTPTLYDIIFSNYDITNCIQKTEYGDIVAADEGLINADALIKPSPKMYKYILKALLTIKEKYDYVIIDTPPQMGILLGNTLMASDYIICPCTCDSFGVQGIIDFYKMVLDYKEDNPHLKILGLLIIKYKGRQNLTKDIEDNLLPKYAKLMQTKVFNTKIRECVKCQEAQTMRKSIFEYCPNSTTAKDYLMLTNEILRDLKLNN